MNYLVQRGKVRGQVINVPDGLPELLSDITREVLRCQPTTECLCQFIIDYLHSVLVTREKARMAKQIIDRALHIVDEIISDLCICDITKAKADEMALVMEECFRRFLETRRCERNKEKEIVKFQEEDMLDELIKRCKFTDYELKMSRPMIEAAYNRFVEAYMQAQEGTEGTEALYQYFKMREERRQEELMQNAAAIKIQASYRGHKVRTQITVPKPLKVQVEGPVTEVALADLEELEKAARTIQKFYRSYIVARNSLPIKEVCEPGSITSMKKEPEVVEVVIVDTAPESEAPPTAVPAGPEPEAPPSAAPEPEPAPEPSPEPEAPAAEVEAPPAAEEAADSAPEAAPAAEAAAPEATAPPEETQE